MNIINNISIPLETTLYCRSQKCLLSLISKLYISIYLEISSVDQIIPGIAKNRTTNSVVLAYKWRQNDFNHLPPKAKVNIYAIKGNFRPFINAKSEYYFNYFKVNVFPNQNLEEKKIVKFHHSKPILACLKAVLPLKPHYK